MINIFDFDDYRMALISWLDNRESSHGYRSVLARAAGCQPAYLSQVLASSVHLTPEHAAGIIDYWQLDRQSSEYFLTLVNIGRAGSESLRQKLRKQAKDLKDQVLSAASQVTKVEKSKEAAPLIYYSRWIVSAIHVLLSIESFQNPAVLAQHLSIPLQDVEIVLSELARIGLATESKGLWVQTVTRIHADDEMLVSRFHHKNWRHHLSEVIDQNQSDAIHYTAPCTLSKKDFAEISALLGKIIQKSRRIVEPSKEEIGACLIIDWFKI